ncbi:MAG: AraC family transcriptional regulator [Oscillospiraceae bacterium]|jgi:AraC-like DNA-binding protein|nr:AraC family transcriptional regulator [Oscillospiraceae bacterium]
MYLDYRLNIEKESVWLISHLQAATEKPPFFVEEIGKFWAKKEYYTRREDKDMYLLLYTLSGEGVLSYEGGTWALSRGTVALIDCRPYHDYHTAPGSEENWMFYWMHVDRKNCDYYYKSLFADGFSLLVPGVDYEIKEVFETLIESYDDLHPDTLCFMSHHVSGLLTKLLTYRDWRKAQDYEHRDIIEAAVAYIKEHFHRPIDVEDMAQRVGLSKYYFIKLFRERLHTTPYQYLLVHRINESKKLLISTDRKVLDIAFAVGFSDGGHFSRTFRRITGVTPCDYRQEWHNRNGAL